MTRTGGCLTEGYWLLAIGRRAIGRLDLHTTAMWPFSLFFTSKWRVVSQEKREARNALIQEAQRGLPVEATTGGDKYTRVSGASWSLYPS